MHYEALRQLCHERQQDRLREADARRVALKLRAQRQQRSRQQAVGAAHDLPQAEPHGA